MSVTIFFQGICANRDGQTKTANKKHFEAFAPSPQAKLKALYHEDSGRLAAGKAAVKRQRALQEGIYGIFFLRNGLK